ncbi:SLAM family member 6-like [Pituophis catenifer annectens]|uniref:SLAM family member 6-like n=1 Tax=Pituophis catenifer annectens TaxID=94852 RepID=UPI003996C8B3
MQPQNVFWVTLLLFYFQAETSPVQLNGVLGKSITFQINESKPFATISWFRIEKNSKFSTLALVAPKKPCKLLIPLPAFKERVSSTKDCRNLHLSHLSQEDMNRYTANIALTTSEKINEHFDLKVYKHLQNEDLSINCTINRGQTKSLQLNCSVERWNDKLDVQWGVAEGIISRVTHENLLTINYTSRQIFDQEVSCKVENPVSKVSKTMTLKEACSKHKRYVSRKTMVARFIVAGLSMFSGIVVAFTVWLIPCHSRRPWFPCTTFARTAEEAQMDPENPLPPPPQPPG